MAADVKIFPDRAALGRAAADWFEAVVAENPGRIVRRSNGRATRGARESARGSRRAGAAPTRMGQLVETGQSRSRAPYSRRRE